MDFYHLKLICTHQAHQNPQKTCFYFNRIIFWGGFDVPGGCKSILIGKTPHISYITELFGLMVFFFFRWVEKFEMFHKNRRFWPHLKKNFNMIFSSYVGTVCADLMVPFFKIVFSVADSIIRKSVRSKMLQNNFWRVRKKN